MLLNLPGNDFLYREVYRALKAAIGAGKLAPGARLPSTRMLATDLKVSRNTIMLAYEQLLAEGYVVARGRSATIVAEAVSGRAGARPDNAALRPARLSTYGRRVASHGGRLPLEALSTTRPRVDFRYGDPAVADFPHATWRRLMAARARKPSPSSIGYASARGYEPLRAQLAEYLRRARGMACEADQIVVVNGSQQAFDLVARLLLDAGDAVAIEEPNYAGARLIFEAAGARLLRIPVDAAGLDPDALPAEKVRLAYVTPCHQFPTGVIMPAGRRLALLDWASRAGAYLVEDDYVSEYRYEGRPLEPLHALDRTGAVIYIGTLSKILFPALRLAYLVLPRPLVTPFVTAKFFADRFSPTLPQETLTDFMAHGHFDRHLRRSCARNARRRQVLTSALTMHFGDRVEIAGGNAGVHLLVWFNDLSSDDGHAVVERAARAGIGIYPVTPCYARPPRRLGLLFGYASVSEAGIRTGIRRLAEVM
jgi:GntR family transcriptional regulator / MocR family aminotransferase